MASSLFPPLSFLMVLHAESKSLFVGKSAAIGQSNTDALLVPMSLSRFMLIDLPEKSTESHVREFCLQDPGLFRTNQATGYIGYLGRNIWGDIFPVLGRHPLSTKDGSVATPILITHSSK